MTELIEKELLDKFVAGNITIKELNSLKEMLEAKIKAVKNLAVTEIMASAVIIARIDVMLYVYNQEEIKAHIAELNGKK